MLRLLATTASLTFLFTAVAAEPPAVSEEEFRQADELLRKVADDFGSQNLSKAAFDLDRLFKPATKARFEAWEKWRQGNLESAKDGKLREALLHLCPLQTFTFIDQEPYSATAYLGPDGKWVLHGNLIRFWIGTDEIEEKWAYAHGKRDGPAESYHLCAEPKPHAELSSVLTYKNGIPDGPYHRLTNAGMPETQGQYVNGQMDGEWIVRDSDGKELGRYTMKMGTGIERAFFPNGQIYRETEYVAGRESGRYECWDPNGEKTTQGQMKYLEENKVSVPHGRWLAWQQHAIKPKRLIMDLEFRDGIPWKGFAEISLMPGKTLDETPVKAPEDTPAERVEVKEGRFLREGKELGDWVGRHDFSHCESELELNDSRVWNGYFFRNTYSDGKPVRSYSPPDEDPYGSAWLNEKIRQTPK